MLARLVFVLALVSCGDNRTATLDTTPIGTATESVPSCHPDGVQPSGCEAQYGSAFHEYVCDPGADPRVGGPGYRNCYSHAIVEGGPQQLCCDGR